MKERKSIAKWGFGMAPISSRMQRRYDAVVQIATAKNTEVFIHSSQVIESDLSILKSGTVVEFDLGRSPKGSCALRLQILQDIT